jgi:hypothetical protein
MLRAAFALLLLGLCLTMLLNGQEFTNGLLAIFCFLVAAGLAWRGKRPERPAGFVVALLAILAAGLLIVRLPDAYRSQRGFNRRLEQARQAGREPEAGSGAAPGPGAGASATMKGQDGGPREGREGR